MMDLTFEHQALKLPNRRWLVLSTDKAVLNAGIIMAYQKSLFFNRGAMAEVGKITASGANPGF